MSHFMPCKGWRCGGLDHQRVHINERRDLGASSGSLNDWKWVIAAERRAADPAHIRTFCGAVLNTGDDFYSQQSHNLSPCTDR